MKTVIPPSFPAQSGIREAGPVFNRRRPLACTLPERTNHRDIARAILQNVEPQRGKFHPGLKHDPHARPSGRIHLSTFASAPYRIFRRYGEIGDRP